MALRGECGTVGWSNAAGEALARVDGIGRWHGGAVVLATAAGGARAQCEHCGGADVVGRGACDSALAREGPAQRCWRRKTRLCGGGVWALEQGDIGEMRG